MQFAYTAKTSAGDIQSGIMDATDVEGVRRALREQSLFPIDVRQNVGDSFWKMLVRFRSRPRVGKRDLLNMTTQLAIMTRSGVDLTSALESLAEQCQIPALKKVLQAVHRDVTGGKSVSDAMRVNASVFGAAYVASVAAGEAAGELPEVLGRLAQLTRSELRVRGTVKTLLTYPILLSSVSGLVVCGLVGFVLPQFEGIFGEFDVPLPAITQVVLALSTVMRQFAWLWIPLALTAAVGLLAATQSTYGRRKIDSAMLNTFLVRDITRAFYIGRTFRLMGLMIESGVPLLEALQLTRRSVKNSLYRELFDDLEEAILNGRGLASSLIQAGFVPPVAAEMVVTAERTGTLGMVTQMMGEHYEEEGEAKLREMATMLEPMIIVVMGVIVATIVLSVMLPMFEIATIAR